MRLFVPAHHGLHRPQKDYSDGLPPFDHLEVPERIDLLLAGMQAAGSFDVEHVEGEALADVRALHDAEYVDFLLETTGRLEAGQEYVPAVFREDLSRAPAAFRGGMYCKELGTPIGPGTIRAGLNSGATAITAAEYVAQTKDDALALCRPPGHHAGRRRYGGYSYFNNAYLAAHRLTARGLRCPVLDVDYHLGDGSLEFASAAAPYFSLHADPWRNYPYLDAGADLERPHVRLAVVGAGARADAYFAQLRELLGDIRALRPDVVLVSLGFDTVASDYIQDEQIGLAPEDFAELGGTLASLPVPVVLILEGGYDANSLAACGRAYMKGHLSRRQAP